MTRAVSAVLDALVLYASQTAADNDVDYAAAVRMMADEPSTVAEDTGVSIADVRAWAAEHMNRAKA